MKVLRLVLPALAALAACEVPPARSNARYLEEADALYLRGEYVQAAGYYEEYLRSNSADPDRARILAKAGRCHLAAGRPDPAIKSFGDALAASPEPGLRREVTFRRAIAFRLKGDLPRALEGFRAAAASAGGDVTNDELRYETAIAHYRAGDWKAAQAELKAVSDQGPFRKEKAVRMGLSAFTVLVGEYAQEAQARGQETLLKRHAAVPAVVPVRTDAPVYLVTAGAFPRHDDAQREAERLRALGFSGAAVIP